MISELIQKRLNGNQLKLIAVISMLIDHTGLEIVGRGILFRLSAESAGYQKWYLVYLVMRSVGRMAFPIYAYLLVEGYTHTRDWKKYAARLGVFAILSEVPFDLLATGQMISWSAQNVFFTLFAGLLMMKMLDMARQSQRMVLRPETGMFIQFLVIGITCILAWIIKSDYDYTGILLIAIFYWFRGAPENQCAAGFVWCAWMFQKWYYICGYFSAFAVLYLYNGRRGNRKWKYGYYVFYPAHMLALVLIFHVGGLN